MSPAALRLLLDPTGAMPLYSQIAQGLRAAIAGGQLAPGEALPSVRELGAQLGVNYHTVARACQELEEAGLLDRPRGGAFRVRQGGDSRAAEEQLHEALNALVREAFAQGVPADTLNRWWAAALATHPGGAR